MPWLPDVQALATALGTTGPPVVVELSGRSLDDLRAAPHLAQDPHEVLPEHAEREPGGGQPQR